MCTAKKQGSEPACAILRGNRVEPPDQVLDGRGMPPAAPRRHYVALIQFLGDACKRRGAARLNVCNDLGITPGAGVGLLPCRPQRRRIPPQSPTPSRP